MQVRTAPTAILPSDAEDAHESVFPFDGAPIVDEHGQPVAVAQTSEPILPGTAIYDLNAVLADALKAGEGKKDPRRPVFTDWQRAILDSDLPASAYVLDQATGRPYVPAVVFDRLADHVFGHGLGAWSTEVLSQEILFRGDVMRDSRLDKSTEYRTYRCAVRATVQVTVVDPRGGTHKHTAVGYTSSTGRTTKAGRIGDEEKIERIAIKGAVTDGRRTALERFGRVFARPDHADDGVIQSLRMREEDERAWPTDGKVVSMPSSAPTSRVLTPANSLRMAPRPTSGRAGTARPAPTIDAPHLILLNGSIAEQPSGAAFLNAYLAASDNAAGAAYKRDLRNFNTALIEALRVVSKDPEILGLLARVDAAHGAIDKAFSDYDRNAEIERKRVAAARQTMREEQERAAAQRTPAAARPLPLSGDEGLFDDDLPDFIKSPSPAKGPSERAIESVPADDRDETPVVAGTPVVEEPGAGAFDSFAFDSLFGTQGAVAGLIDADERARLEEEEKALAAEFADIEDEGPASPSPAPVAAAPATARFPDLSAHLGPDGKVLDQEAALKAALAVIASTRTKAEFEVAKKTCEPILRGSSTKAVLQLAEGYSAHMGTLA